VSLIVRAFIAPLNRGAPDEAGTRQELHHRFLPGSDCDTHVVIDDVPIEDVTVSGHRLSRWLVESDHQHQDLGRYLLEFRRADDRRR
jgi:hypothetical protein